MTDSPAPERHAAVARVKSGRSFSIVWLVPIVALLIGGWLAVKALQERGEIVTISFVSAEGLEAGKTKIKFKDVVIGQVEEIRLSDDLRHVMVTAELSRDAEKFLNDKTRFWVVRAEIRGGTVSGLGTVLSGAYIGIDPGMGGVPTTEFIGLEVPPVVTTGQPGRHFRLRAERLGSLTIGAPVYYRQIQVGQVVSYGFSPDGQAIDLHVFVEAPHHALVTENTRFWNASGIDVTLDAQGLKIDTDSLVSVIVGGIAFDRPNGTLPGKEADDNTLFRLYPDKASIQDKTYTVRHHWLLLFDQSVRGLSVGAPVESHGIKIGEVVGLELEYNAATRDFRVPVLIVIEPERIRGVDAIKGLKADAAHPEAMLKWLVEQRRLRAQLKTGNLLTGQMVVDLDFHPGAPRATLAHVDGYPVVPTVPGSLEQLQENLARIAARLEKVPFEQIGSEMQQTLQEARIAFRQTGELAGKLNSETAPQLKTTLDELQKTLIELQSLIGRDAPLNHSARQAFDELTLTLRSLRELADSLERQPESVLFGKGEENDE